MAKLTSEQRKRLPAKAFALPGGRYPIEDRSHAANALSRVSQNGSPEEKATVRSKVHAKYPDMGMAGGGNVGGNLWKYAGGGETPEDDDATEQPVFAQPSVTPAQPNRVPATSRESATSLRGQLQQYLGKQAAASDNMQKLVDLYGQRLADQNDRTDLSPLIGLSDSLYGSKLGHVYQRPLSPVEQLAKKMEVQILADKEKQALTAAAERQYGQDSNTAAKEQGNYFRQLASNAKDEAKRAKDQEKLITGMHDDMFFKRGTNPQVSQSINKLQRATSAIALVDSLKSMTPDQAQLLVTSGEMSNLATSIAGMVGNNNVISEHKLREITPKNVKLTGSDILAWFLAEPEGTDQKKWIDRLTNEIDTEARAAHHTLSNYQDAQADSYMGRIPEFIHQQQREAGRRFLQHSYYHPDNPGDYLGQPKASAPAQPEAKASATPPEPDAVPVKKGNLKGWRLKSGKIVPRE